MQQLPKLVYLLAWKGETEKNTGGALANYRRRRLKPNLILDDGGDLTALMHKDYKDMLKNIKGVQKKQQQVF